MIYTGHTYSAAAIASVEHVLDPGEAVGVGGSRRRAGLVPESTLGLNVLLPQVGTVRGAHVGLADLVGPV